MVELIQMVILTPNNGKTVNRGKVMPKKQILTDRILIQLV